MKKLPTVEEYLTKLHDIDILLEEREELKKIVADTKEEKKELETKISKNNYALNFLVEKTMMMAYELKKPLKPLFKVFDSIMPVIFGEMVCHPTFFLFYKYLEERDKKARRIRKKRLEALAIGNRKVQEERQRRNNKLPSRSTDA